MKITEQALKIMKNDVIGKDVLEAACGRADLSVAMSPIARTVECIDLVDFRLNPKVAQCANVRFSVMDAPVRPLPTDLSIRRLFSTPRIT